MSFNPNEPRGYHGRWTLEAAFRSIAGQNGPKSADDVHSMEDLRRFSRMPVSVDAQGNENYTHAVRSDSEIGSIVKNGISLGSAGRIFASKPPLVRDRGAGYVVFRSRPGHAKKGVDFVERGLSYPEYTFTRNVGPADIIKVVRTIRVGGHPIREDELAQYALEHQGLDDADVRALPDKYRRWFNLGVG